MLAAGQPGDCETAKGQLLSKLSDHMMGKAWAAVIQKIPGSCRIDRRSIIWGRGDGPRLASNEAFNSLFVQAELMIDKVELPGRP